MPYRPESDALLFVDAEAVNIQFMRVHVKNGRHVSAVESANRVPGDRPGQQPEIPTTRDGQIAPEEWDRRQWTFNKATVFPSMNVPGGAGNAVAPVTDREDA